MARLMKPTRTEYEAIRWVSPNPDNWMIKKRSSDFLTIVHRETGTERIIPT
jgi:hypothetical protein